MSENESSQPVAEKSRTFKSSVTILTYLGLLGVLAGLINLFGAAPSVPSNVRLADVVFNIVFGVLIFICSRVVARGKALAIWLFGGCVLFSIIYSFAMGRGFNVVMAAAGAIFIWQLFNLKKQGELS